MSPDSASTSIGTNAFHAIAGELHDRRLGGITLVEADIDRDGAADLASRLKGDLDLVARDFVLQRLPRGGVMKVPLQASINQWRARNDSNVRPSDS